MVEPLILSHSLKPRPSSKEEMGSGFESIIPVPQQRGLTWMLQYGGINGTMLMQERKREQRMTLILIDAHHNLPSLVPILPNIRTRFLANIISAQRVQTQLAVSLH